MQMLQRSFSCYGLRTELKEGDNCLEPQQRDGSVFSDAQILRKELKLWFQSIIGGSWEGGVELLTFALPH